MQEAKFRKSKKVAHLADVPMFSIFVDADIVHRIPHKETFINNITEGCKAARKRITKMGFPAMKTNIVIKDLAKRKNQNTGGGVAGYAQRKGNYMAIDGKYTAENNHEELVDIIVHEWAHLWMFNNSKGFKKAIMDYYQLLKGYSDEGEKPSKWDEPESYTDHANYGYKQEDAVWTHVNKQFYNLIKWRWAELAGGAFPDPDDMWDSTVDSWEDFENKARGNIYSMLHKVYGILLDNDSPPPPEIDKMADKYIMPALPEVEKYLNKKLENFKYDVKDAVEETGRPPHEVAHELMYNDDLADLGMGTTDENYQKIYNVIGRIYPRVDLPERFTYSADQVIQARKRKFAHKHEDFAGKRFNKTREDAARLVRWSRAYGMSNDDELWATGIEHFMKLPKDHKAKIMQLMTTR